VLLKLLVSSGRVVTFGALAEQLAMSASEVHASVGRATAARLVNVTSDHLQPAIEVSPSAGSFLPQQHFDAAVLLPLGGAAVVATMQASVGGTALALNYPGTCQLATPFNSGRAALLCPGADAALTSLQGITQIDWLVTLSDGSSYTQSVQWNLVH
jgi:hypothetical protein